MRHLLVRSLLSMILVLALAPVLGPLGLPRARAQTGLPDLVAADLIASPASPGWDEPITVSWTVENRSERPIGSRTTWYETLHLSTDRALDIYDDDLGVFHAQGPLAAGGHYTGGEQVDLPIMPTGIYYLILTVDGDDDLDEGDETNNVVVSSALTVNGLDIDLVPTAVSIGAETASPGGSLTVTWSVANRGDDAIPSAKPNGNDVIWFHSLYLSSDATFGEDDRSLSLRRASDDSVHGPLASGDGYTLTADATVPVLPTGSYTLLIVVDREDFLRETDEANNVLAGPTIAITGLDIDLAPAELTTSTANARWYQRITVTWTVANAGTDAVPPRGGDPGVWVGSDTVWYDELYLSPDGILDDTDPRLEFVSQEGPIAAGDQYTTTVEVTLPVVPDGTYYLLVVVDSSSRLSEREEANNALIGPLVTIAGVDVDLVPTALTPSRLTAAPGDEIEFEWVVVNDGTDAIPDGAVWYDEVYLSADAARDDDDTLLQSMGGWAIPPFERQGPLAAGDHYDATLRVTLPTDISEARYLLIVVDAGNALQERAETNNVQAIPFNMKSPPATILD